MASTIDRSDRSARIGHAGPARYRMGCFRPINVQTENRKIIYSGQVGLAVGFGLVIRPSFRLAAITGRTEYVSVRKFTFLASVYFSSFLYIFIPVE